MFDRYRNDDDDDDDDDVLCSDDTDSVLQIVVSCHKHHKHLSHDSHSDDDDEMIIKYEAMMRRALVHADDQVHCCLLH